MVLSGLRETEAGAIQYCWFADCLVWTRSIGPLVKRLRRSPLKAESGVRFPHGSLPLGDFYFERLFWGPLAQLVRATGS